MKYRQYVRADVAPRTYLVRRRSHVLGGISHGGTGGVTVCQVALDIEAGPPKVEKQISELVPVAEEGMGHNSI